MGYTLYKKIDLQPILKPLKTLQTHFRVNVNFSNNSLNYHLPEISY